MKIKMPSLKDRAYIYRKLSTSFKAGYTDESLKFFNQALRRFCDAMGLRTPKVEWYKTLGPRTLGLCGENGVIKLISADAWTKNKTSLLLFQRGWINTVYHELGHYYLWADAEKKARNFAEKMWRR